MEVVKITPRGYCHGVVEAIRLAKKVGAERSASEPVHMLGHLVHNDHVINDLAQSGITLVDAPDRMEGLNHISGGTVIFTAHGISPAVVDAAKERGLNVVDATCSDVTRTHDLIRQLVGDGYHVIYIGKRGHPEPAGAMGVAPDHMTLIETIEEVDQLAFADDTKLAVTCQTTLSVWDTRAIIQRLSERFPNIDVYNEICLATQQRQEAAVAAAADVDCVVVVGSPRSSNSRRLVQVVEAAGKPAYLVDSPDELRTGWFDGIAKVGVTSGASTPTEITRAVIHALEAMGNAGA